MFTGAQLRQYEAQKEGRPLRWSPPLDRQVPSCRGLSRHVLLGLSNPVASVSSRQILSRPCVSRLVTSCPVRQVKSCRLRSLHVRSRPVLSVMSRPFISRRFEFSHVRRVLSGRFRSRQFISQPDPSGPYRLVSSCPFRSCLVPTCLVQTLLVTSVLT